MHSPSLPAICCNLQSAICTSTTTPKLSIPTFLSTSRPARKHCGTLSPSHPLTTNSSRVCRSPHFDQRRIGPAFCFLQPTAARRHRSGLRTLADRPRRRVCTCSPSCSTLSWSRTNSQPPSNPLNRRTPSRPPRCGWQAIGSAETRWFTVSTQVHELWKPRRPSSVLCAARRECLYRSTATLVSPGSTSKDHYCGSPLVM